MSKFYQIILSIFMSIFCIAVINGYAEEGGNSKVNPERFDFAQHGSKHGELVEPPSPAVNGGDSRRVDWKEEMRSDKQELRQEWKDIKEAGQEARGEERALHQQIEEAMKAGDQAKATELKKQLKEMRQGHIQDMRQEKAEVREERKAMHDEWKDKREEWREEHKGENEGRPRRDLDNNPPGKRGGAGTNWENPPGARGGKGASPDQSRRRDLDNNPPGKRGGAGTNWENPPGSRGGKGASPDQNRRRDLDNNPPGKRGGAGTNWENPPGSRGGQGTSPHRGHQGGMNKGRRK